MTSCSSETRPLPPKPLDDHNNPKTTPTTPLPQDPISSRLPQPDDSVNSLHSLDPSIHDYDVVSLPGDPMTPPGYEYHKNDQLLPNPRYVDPDLSNEELSNSPYSAPNYPDSAPSPPQLRHERIDMYPDPLSSPRSPKHSLSFEGTVDRASMSDSLSYIDAPTRPPVQTFGPIPEVHTIHHIGSFDPSVVGSSSSQYYPNYYLPNSNPSDISGPDDPLEDIRALGRDGEIWEQRHISDEERLWDTASEDSETQFVNYSLLSHLAVRLRDTVPRGTHVKGSIPYPRAFTGKDIVVRHWHSLYSCFFYLSNCILQSAIQSQIQRDLMENHGGSSGDRRAALQVARSLQSQLFFYEVEWGSRMLQDGVEDVYMFLDDQEGGPDATPEREELPTGVVTILAKCYSPSCGEDGPPCYVNTCPRKVWSLLLCLRFDLMFYS